MGFLTDKKQETGVVTNYAKIEGIWINSTLKQAKIHIVWYTSKEDRDANYLPVANSVVELNLTPPTTNEEVDNRPKEIADFPFNDILAPIYKWLKGKDEFKKYQDM